MNIQYVMGGVILKKWIKGFILSSMAMLFVASIPMTSFAATDQIKDVKTSACDYGNGWINPDCTTNRSTIYSIPGGELRVGYYNGKQYGWGKLTSGSGLWFDVSNDGGKTIATYDFVNAIGNTTKGYIASSSTSRKFRICNVSGNCGPWW